jgi:hypothetical protein
MLLPWSYMTDLFVTQHTVVMKRPSEQRPYCDGHSGIHCHNLDKDVHTDY